MTVDLDAVEDAVYTHHEALVKERLAGAEDNTNYGWAVEVWDDRVVVASKVYRLGQVLTTVSSEVGVFRDSWRDIT